MMVDGCTSPSDFLLLFFILQMKIKKGPNDKKRGLDSPTNFIAKRRYFDTTSVSEWNTKNKDDPTGNIPLSYIKHPSITLHSH